MICSNCKNPIEDNSTVCEWCGASVTSKEESTTDLNQENKSGCISIFWGIFAVVGVIYIIIDTFI